jgi:hypothetical protein
MERAWVSREMIFGVMPLAMRVWNPLIAPQAMVMKQNGKTLPGTTGPFPLAANSVSAGIFISGRMRNVPKASARMVPSLRKVLR